MHGGGWVVPMAYLLNNDLIRQYGCNSVRAASEYFQKACVPGALTSYYRHDTTHLNLCHLCRGSGVGYCARDHSEPYYGFSGKLGGRCLCVGVGIGVWGCLCVCEVRLGLSLSCYLSCSLSLSLSCIKDSILSMCLVLLLYL